MLGRATAVTAMMLLASLAGCLSKDQGPEPVVEDNTTTAGFVDAENASKAPDGRGDISAFKETNRTETEGIGAMVHMHDYWAGESRRLVYELSSGLIPFPLFPCKTPGTCTAGGGGETYPAGTAIADYDIPNDRPGYGFVYEGTSQLEILLNYAYAPTACEPIATGACTPGVDHPMVTANIDYLTAADEPGQFRNGGVMQVGVPLIIPVAPTEADMPHQTKSLWIFRIYSSEPTWWEWNITITAVKGNNVVDWPPHPDLYAEKTERTVFEGPVHLESKGMADSNLYGSDAGWVNPERILSWGTDRIEVTVKDMTIATEGGVVEPAGFVLEYHNASKPPLLGHGAQYGGRLTDEGSDGTTWSFSIDISQDPDSYDSPYGEKSRWGFRFVPQFDNGGEACVDNEFAQQFLVGCQIVPWTMDYTMTIKAIGHSTATETLPDETADAQ